MNVCLAPCPVVFDLDGTLIDSAPDIQACVNAVLTDIGAVPLGLNEVRGFIGEGVETLWRKVVAARRLDDARMSDLIRAFMALYEHAHDRTTVFPEVPETLETLAGRGHPLGICTNKPLSVTHAALAHAGLAHLFDCLIGGDSTPFRKPHPLPLRTALERLGADPRRPHAIYVGDSEFDAACAASLGVPFLLYAQGYRRSAASEMVHAAAFDDFSQLPALVEAHGQREGLSAAWS